MEVNAKIEARDKAGVLLGEEVWDVPETMAEVLDTFEEKDIIQYCVAAHVIKIQAELRRKARPSTTNKTPAEIAFAKLSKEEKAKLMGIEA